MNVYEINSASLKVSLGVPEVPEVFVLVAKHQVMGLAAEQIADTLGADLEDIRAVESDELYVRVREFVSQVYAQQTANQSSGWDAIEETAIKNLMLRLPFEKDSEFLLKVAAVANRATRKHEPAANVLDPAKFGGRRTITLTQRLVSRINRDGDQVREETRQLSIKDGSMSNPSFVEIDSLLSVRNKPVLPTAVEIRTRSADPTEAELLEDLMRRT